MQVSPNPNDEQQPQPSEQQPENAAIIPFVIGDDAVIGGEDRQPAPLPADEPLPSDTLFPGTSEE